MLFGLGAEWLPPNTFEEIMIKKSGSTYKVVSEKGKNLGSGYKTKGEAEKRLQQVEYFKHQHSPIEGLNPPPTPGTVLQPPEVLYAADPHESRAVDINSFGRDWEPLKLDERIFHMEPETHEEDLVEYGRLYQPGERESNQD